jgi:phosphohistidine phosphatase
VAFVLLLVRHGEARAEAEDPQRALSELGRAQASAVARAVGALRPGLRELWHSGKLRAEQTARILGEALACPEEVRAHPGLEPNAPAARIAGELVGLDRSVGIVGHLPHLGRLASVLLTGREEPELFQFPAAGALCLEREESGWKVRWFLTPETCGI